MDCEMGRCPEAEKSDALTFFDSRHPQRTEANDTGTEQRRGAEVIELRRNGKAEIGAGERVFGVTSVHGVTGEGGTVAEVFQAAAAKKTGAIGAAKPGDTDAGAFQCRTGGDARPPKLCCGIELSGDYFAYDLVPGNNSWIARREFAFYDMQVGATDPTGKDTQQNVAGLELWSWNIFHVKRRLRDRRWGGEDSGFHAVILFAHRWLEFPIEPSRSRFDRTGEPPVPHHCRMTV
jgi:hypothetical protein